MDKIGLARLIAYLCSLSRHDFARYEISQIDGIIVESLQSKSQPAVPSPQDVISLMENMGADRKIEAIKAYRALTGHGLKESKDAVERIMDRLRPLSEAA